MASYQFGTADFTAMAMGAAILASGVVSSFAGLLRNIGYAGAMPYPGT